MIEDKIIKLKKEFIKIKEMGYVKSTRKGFTGIGKTFEDLIGKEEDNLEEPDYNGIEIKTKRGYSSSYTTLFNATPKGKTSLETQRLCNRYGYPDKILKDKKVLNISATTTPVLVAKKYLFYLKVDKLKQKIYLIIKDRWGNTVEDSVYWDFKMLEEKLTRKLKYIAFVSAWPNQIGNETYYKYYKIQFYELKSFEKFIELINDGTIRISIKMAVFREGPKKGMPHDRGTSFELKHSDFHFLFGEVYI